MQGLSEALLFVVVVFLHGGGGSRKDTVTIIVRVYSIDGLRWNKVSLMACYHEDINTIIKLVQSFLQCIISPAIPPFFLLFYFLLITTAFG